MVGCSVPICKNSSSKGYRLFRFPRNSSRQAVWLKNCRRDNWKPTSTSRLCEVHFEESEWESTRADGWKKLKRNAVPTIFNVPNPPKRITSMRQSYCKKAKHCERKCSSATEETVEVYGTSPLSSERPDNAQRRKKARVEDRRLDEAFSMLQNTSSDDEPQLFGNLVAKKLQNCDPVIRSEIQQKILQLFHIVEILKKQNTCDSEGSKEVIILDDEVETIVHIM